MSLAPASGIYVPALLFFADDEEFDVPAIEAHILRLAKGGVTGILVQGSNGEAQHLSHEERSRAITLTRRTLDANGFQNVLIVAGTGVQSTRETIILCEEAAAAGATHALVLTPSTWPPQMTRANIIRFHTIVADKSPIPTMVYNFPTVTAGQNLDSDIIAELSKHPNIVGTKLSCGDIGKLHRLTHSGPPASRFAVFPGLSAVLAQAVLSGSAGVIGALVNLVPKVHVRVYELVKEGRIAEALELQGLLAHGDWIAGRAGGVAGLKGLVARHFGYGTGNVRGPLSPATVEELDTTNNTVLLKLVELEKSL